MARGVAVANGMHRYQGATLRRGRRFNLL